MQKGFSLAFIRILFLTFNFLLFSAAHATEKIHQPASLTQIKQLIAAHKTQEAYQLASQMARQEEGNPNFDLLLGSVAIDAKHPDVAVFALDRVLMQQPGNLYAKEKLGQAYYLIGDYSSAKPLLQAIIASGAPQALRREAQKILEQTKHPPKNNAQAKSSVFSLEVSGGYDSNINSATVSSSINIPDAFTHNAIPIPVDSRATHDQIADFTGDWQGYYPLPASTEAGLFWDINDTYRDNIHHSLFNLNTLNTTGGFMLQEGHYTLRVPLRAQIMYLNDAPLRRALAMSINVSRLINARHAGMLFIEKGTQIYPTHNPLSQATNLAGGGWLYLPDNKTQIITRAYYGIGEGKLGTQASDSSASHYYGAQLSLARTMFDKSTASIDLGEQFATYNIIDPIFLILRKDNFFNLGLTYQWKYNQNVTVIGNYTHYQNNSDLPLFQYSRNIAELGLRYVL